MERLENIRTNLCRGSNGTRLLGLRNDGAGNDITNALLFGRSGPDYTIKDEYVSKCAILYLKPCNDLELPNNGCSRSRHYFKDTPSTLSVRHRKSTPSWC